MELSSQLIYVLGREGLEGVAGERKQAVNHCFLKGGGCPLSLPLSPSLSGCFFSVNCAVEKRMPAGRLVGGGG